MDLSLQDGATLAAHVAMGIGLSAAAGLRAFLPLLVVGVAGRFDLVPLSQSFDWISGWPALTVFGVAVVFELAGDKLPIVDNFLDTFQTFVKPIAGALLMASAVTDWAPLYVAVFSIVTGGTIAGGVHVAKAKLRLASSVTTAGLGNPVLSIAEDVVALGGSVLSIVAPVLMALAVLIGFVVMWFVLRPYLRPLRHSRP